MASAPWSWTDSIPSWTWSDVGEEPLEVEVYTDADEVELLSNGTSLGRRPTGPEHRYRAVFEVPYASGSLEAIAIRDGVAAEQTVLRMASDDRRLALTAEHSEVATDDLAFIAVELVDAAGVRATDIPVEVELHIEGAGVLQGFGNAQFSTEESFADARHHLHDGRALAVIRATAPGRITVMATADGFDATTVELTAR